MTSDPTSRRRLESHGYLELKRFLEERMTMSHVYQPLMIRTILAGGGAATRRQIAAAFLAADLSQLEYYEQITKGYPTQTLSRHGIITHQRGVYRLSDPLVQLNEWERAALIALCDHRLADYVAQRQDTIWRHRSQNFDPIPGTVRYAVIARAKGRCEACGISSQERALQVDHIVPRARGGSNELSNFQALCSTCNAQKLDRDETDFHAAHLAYDHREPACAVCQSTALPILDESSLAMAWRPPGADVVLIAPRRHLSDYAGLTQPEINAIRGLELTGLATLTAEALRPRRYRLVTEWGDDETAHLQFRLEPAGHTNGDREDAQAEGIR